MELKTSKEMAQILRLSDKTFRLYVKKHSLPFYGTGKSRRFNPSEVLRRLKSFEPVPAPAAETKPKKKAWDFIRTKENERFAEMLDL